jgi:hypothetical protein
MLLVCGLCAFADRIQAQTSYDVAPFGLNAAWRFNSTSNNPTLTFFRGVTYIINTTGGSTHPFWIKTNSVFTLGGTDQYTNGVVNNGATLGSITFNVPAVTPAKVFYVCGNHSAMAGTINLTNPPVPPPPSGIIVLVSLSETGVTMKSIGATNWNAVPEFNSNLLTATWATVPNFTNTLADGTNTTRFNRLDAICGPNVFLRIRNHNP